MENNTKQTEIVPEELESEFWNSESTSGNSDFLKMTSVREFEIKYIKLKEYIGMKLTAFKDKDNTFRPNFRAEVHVGKNKGKEYVVSFSKPTAMSLISEIKTQDFKAWEGKILSVAIKQKGKYEGIDYSVYVPIPE
jgi:hypothetical protein